MWGDAGDGWCVGDDSRLARMAAALARTPAGGEREPDNPPQPLPGGSSLGPHDEEPPPPRERTGREGATLAVGMEERRKIPET